MKLQVLNKKSILGRMAQDLRKESEDNEMWPIDILEMITKWNNEKPNTLIDNIRYNVYGEIVIQTTSNEFYIYRDHEIVKFK